MFWNILIILFMFFSGIELINRSVLLSPLSSSPSSLSLSPSKFTSLSLIRTYYTAQPPHHFTYTTSLNFENDQNGLTVNDITKLRQIVSRMNQNLQSMTTFHQQLSNDYYNKKQGQTDKSDNNLQLTSNIDNRLWPSHKTIPENMKEEGQWYYDRNYLDYNPEDPRIESSFRLVHELPNDINDTVTHISQITNDSILHSVAVKLGFGIGLSLLILLLIILIAILCRGWLRRNLLSENNIDNNSSNRDFCFNCNFGGKTAIQKITNFSIRKTQKHYKDENNRCIKGIYDVENLWLLEKSRLVVFHEMKLGSGAFCNVYKGAIKGFAPICKINPSLISTGIFKDCMCAVKMLPSIADDIAHADFIQEIKFMKSLKYHPHLISMLGISIDNNGNTMLLTEYCDLGDLLHLVRNRKGEIIMNHTNEHSKLRIKDLVSFAWQISNGLEYLSSIGCVHRDVAARNILVNATNICKIADFGLCRLSDSFIYTGCGGRLPLKWMAPESLRSYEYSVKTDVWSYGILLYEVFSFGEVPYALLQTTEILDFLNSGARLSQPQYCPINIYTLMLQCWQDGPSLRPSFTEICATLRMILEDNFGHYGYINSTN
ncbi:Tyrosine-protein kinase F09A5.2 in chromosome X, putative [Brugia malayi]|uniref:Tyrosine-protein kinase F09A5.2 in chromosome X, putative n=2 Tax=Brugia malayi TaxID=6279 RepID=A0A4E9EV43_BRUMA|nr:Tyrosine-protein kinase F09A5.2 in chromosome X, putative [Brugia malayi]VIO88118.1 Tyrosine-protein kinase F09A5.2 in chromosome X, putative [Brugia malayi]